MSPWCAWTWVLNAGALWAGMIALSLWAPSALAGSAHARGYRPVGALARSDPVARAHPADAGRVLPVVPLAAAGSARGARRPLADRSLVAGVAGGGAPLRRRRPGDLARLLRPAWAPDPARRLDLRPDPRGHRPALRVQLRA